MRSAIQIERLFTHFKIFKYYLNPFLAKFNVIYHKEKYYKIVYKLALAYWVPKKEELTVLHSRTLRCFKIAFFLFLFYDYNTLLNVNESSTNFTTSDFFRKILCFHCLGCNFEQLLLFLKYDFFSFINFALLVLSDFLTTYLLFAYLSTFFRKFRKNVLLLCRVTCLHGIKLKQTCASILPSFPSILSFNPRSKRFFFFCLLQDNKCKCSC